jgi:hypothetical protein
VLGHLDSIWINSSELINTDTLLNAITLNGLSKGVWNKPDHQYQGTEVYYASAVNDRYILLRRKFGNKWWLWGCFRRRTVSIECLVRNAMKHIPGQCAVANSQLEKLLHHCLVCSIKHSQKLSVCNDPLLLWFHQEHRQKRQEATLR